MFHTFRDCKRTDRKYLVAKLWAVARILGLGKMRLRHFAERKISSPAFLRILEIIQQR
jgi:hypothetical protein